MGLKPMLRLALRSMLEMVLKSTLRWCRDGAEIDAEMVLNSTLRLTPRCTMYTGKATATGGGEGGGGDRD